MNNHYEKKAPVLTQKQADQLIRMFNVGFNSALLYGGDHPTTLKNIEPFAALISKELETIPIISIIIERDSLFIDEFSTDKAVNPKRIVSHFAKSNIHSISFKKDLTLRCTQAFFRLAVNMNETHTAEEIEEFFILSDCKGIRLNHVRFEKVTSDETLVSRDTAETFRNITGTDTSQVSLSKSAIDEIQKVISLAKMLEQPGETAKSLAQSIAEDKSGQNAARSIEHMRSEIRTSSPESIEALLNAVLELKVDLSEALEAQKLTGKILAAEDPAQSQMDKLTCDVLVKLIEDEYSSGNISMRRLAQIIRRMLPDMAELKRILPMLKSTLLRDGMQLTDYLMLIRQIDVEVESETLSTLLSDAASGIGASSEDVAAAIKAHPDDAAKLIFLASEIRNGTDQDEMQLSNFLTEYIEKASSSIALDSKDINGPQGDKALGKIITNVQSQLIDKLKLYGIEQPVLLKVKDLLEERYNLTCTATIAEWMADTVSLDSDTEMQGLAQKLASFVNQENSIQNLSAPLFNAFSSKGYSKEQIEGFIQKLSAHIKAGKKAALPSDILSANNMLFMLNREIKQHSRYNTPFCTLLISASAIFNKNQEAHIPSAEELTELTPQLFIFVKKATRDIDLIGSLNNKDAVILVLLTMTNYEGAMVVLKRIHSTIAKTIFTVKNHPVCIDPIISITIPEKEITRDLNTYLENAKINHKNKLIQFSHKR